MCTETKKSEAVVTARAMALRCIPRARVKGEGTLAACQCLSYTTRLTHTPNNLSHLHEPRHLRPPNVVVQAVAEDEDACGASTQEGAPPPPESKDTV